MIDEEKQKLNEKLAQWAGFKEADIKKHYYFKIGGERLPKWQEPITGYHIKLPRFTDSLDACFKWLVPKLKEQGFDVELHDTRMRQKDEWWFGINEGNDALSFGIGEGPALALCLAIERLINGMPVY